MRRGAVPLVALALATAGCGPRPVTEIVIVVRTDLAAESALGAVIIEGKGARGTEIDGLQLFITMCVPIGAAPPRRRPPLTLGVVLDPDAPGSRFVAHAYGYADGACARKVVAQSATVSFVAEQILLLEMSLLASCVGVSCPAGETCLGGGACTPDERATLPPFDPSRLPAADGGDALDGFPLPVDGGAGGGG